ncbi:SwmB domain-containing protein [Paenibacillus oralis]|nr:SwmB domain-containing protein [Paenibacillus oralis]
MKRNVSIWLVMLLAISMVLEPAVAAGASALTQVKEAAAATSYEGTALNQVGQLSMTAGNSSILSNSLAAVSATQATYYPLKTALSPANGGTNVNVNADLVITFDRNVAINSSSGITLRKDSNDSSVSISVKASGRQVIITPKSSLSSGTKYYVEISSRAIVDASNSSYAFAGLSRNEWNFQTTSNSNDKTAPVLKNVTMYNNTTIRLEYDKRLESDSDLRTSYFAVTVNGEKREIDDAYSSGEYVYVVLEAGVAVGQNVRISYSGSGYRAIQDRNGNLAATFSSKEVVNSLDSVLPKPKEGNVSGSTLTLYFNESLKTVPSYAYQQFTVTADGSVKKIDRLNHSGSTITLYLSSSVSNGEVVKVSYTPGSYPIKDNRDMNIPAFSDFLVRNNYDTKAPELVGVDGSVNKIVLRYNEALKTNQIPPKSYFSVLVNNSAVYVTNVEIATDQVILTLASSFTKDQNVTISYVSGPDGIADLNGNLAGYINLKEVVYSTVADGIRSATVNGDLLALVYNKTLRTVSNVPTGQFSVLVNQATRGVQSVSVSGDTVTLKLTTPVTSGQTVELTYYTGTNPLYDSQGTMLRNFSNMPVQNLTGGGTGAVGATQLDFLNTLSSADFGTGGYVFNTKAVTTSVSQSRRGQAIKRYVVDSTKLREALQFLDSSTATSRNLVVEVPSTERAAEVIFPLGSLLDYFSLGKTGNIAVKYKDMMYELPLEKIPYADISRVYGNINLISAFLKVEIEPVPRTEISLKYNSGLSTTPVTDPVQIYVSTYNGTTSGNTVDVAHTGKIYYKVAAAQSSYGTIFLAKFDIAAGTVSYIPSGKSTSGSNTVLTGKLNENTIIGPTMGYSYFSDTTKHWAKNEINELAGKLIISPRSAASSQFEPDKNITRAEFAEFLAKGLGLTGDESSARRFPDVMNGTTGAYIGAAAKAGIITGYADGTFKPNNNITREQMALMMVRAMEYAGYSTSTTGANAATLSKFKDASKIQSKDTVAKAVKEGIIQGMTKNTFQPQGNATRAQAAVMLKRVLEKLNYN